jgi:hypothetical protein
MQLDTITEHLGMPNYKVTHVINKIDIEKRKVIWNHNGRGKYVLEKLYRKPGPEGCDTLYGNHRMMRVAMIPC